MVVNQQERDRQAKDIEDSRYESIYRIRLPSGIEKVIALLRFSLPFSEVK